MATQTSTPPMRASDMLRSSFAGLNGVERSRALAMYGSILAMHVLGFFIPPAGLRVLLFPGPLQHRRRHRSWHHHRREDGIFSRFQ